MIAEILAKLPSETQRMAAEALSAIAEAAGEIPDSQWPGVELEDGPYAGDQPRLGDLGEALSGGSAS